MKKSKRLQKLKNNAVYLLAVFFRVFLNYIPRSAATALGAAVGWCLYYFFRIDHKRGHRALGLVYGNKLTEPEKKKIIHNFYINSGKNIAEAVRLKKYYFRQIDRLVEIEGLEIFDNAYKRGNGVIAITGHIGNFELLAAWFASHGYKCAAIGREMYDKRLDRMLIENRTAMGIKNIDTNSSPRSILRVLKEGYALGVLIDTDSARVRSEFIPAFGIPARTPVGQTIIGLKAGAAFVPMACVRSGKGYKIIVKPEIIIPQKDDFNTNVYNVTKECSKSLETIIDRFRDQWIWIHDRWRSQPNAS